MKPLDLIISLQEIHGSEEHGKRHPKDCCCSVAHSCATLRPPGLQHTRLPYPLLSPGDCTNSCAWSWWCHPTIASSVTPFSSCRQSFPASESFPMGRLFTPGGQSIGTSALASVFPMNFLGWFPLGLTGLVSLLSKGLSRVFSSTHNSKASILQHSAFVMVWLSHPYMTTGKTVALIYGPSSAKWCLCFLTCCLGLS